MKKFLLFVLFLLVSSTLLQAKQEYIQDAVGRKVLIRKVPQRIISLAPVNTEILFALGLGKKVVGVTSYCNYPQEALTIEKVGDFCTINEEKIIALKPDVIFATSGVQILNVKKLENFNITVIAIDAKSIEEIYKEIGLMGQVCGVSSKADILLKSIKKEVAFVQDKVSKQKNKPKVFLEINENFFTVGKKSFINDLITKAGGTNIAGNVNQDYPIYSLEALLVVQPDIYLTSTDSSYKTLQAMLKRQGFNQLHCLQEKRCYFLEADLISRPGPRIGTVLRVLAQIFYPEVWERQK